MDDSLVVGGSESRAHAARDLERLVARQSTNPTQQRSEVLSVHILHDHEVMALGFRDVIETTHIRMSDLTADADFVDEAFEPSRVRGQRRGEKLECDRLTQADVVRSVDLTHASFAKGRHDSVAVREQRPGREPRG